MMGVNNGAYAFAETKNTTKTFVEVAKLASPREDAHFSLLQKNTSSISFFYFLF